MRIEATAIPPLKSKVIFDLVFYCSQPTADISRMLLFWLCACRIEFAMRIEAIAIPQKPNSSTKVLLFFEITKKNKEKSKKNCFLLQMYKKNAIFARYLKMAYIQYRI